jgi:hypothetical protein
MKLVKLTKVINTVKLFVKNHDADILVGSGIVSVVGGVIAGCIGARKVDDILDEHDAEIDDVHALRDDPESDISKSEYNREVAKVYGNTIWSFTKAFTPCVVLTATGIALILKSHSVLKDKNLKLIAAYNILDSSYKSYRERVISKYGEEEDRRLRFGAKEEEKEVEVSGKDGKIKKKKEKVDVYPENCSDYALIFDKFNVNYHREEKEGPYAMRANFMWLRGVQQMANVKLGNRGQLTLNEVYKMLGYPESAAGCVVGWRTSENGGKDGYVSFGIDDENACVVLSDGHDEAILLDFNVDGLIMDDKFDKISGIEANRP